MFEILVILVVFIHDHSRPIHVFRFFVENVRPAIAEGRLKTSGHHWRMLLCIEPSFYSFPLRYYSIERIFAVVQV